MAKIDHKKIKKILPILGCISFYHRHEVVGLEHIPKKGPALFAANHSFATYDILLLHFQVYRLQKRLIRGLMDRWFFVWKTVGDALESLGALEGNPESAKQLLLDGELVCVAPGGMLEAIRSKEHRYEIEWDNRKGFAKLAIESQAPVILAACPKADEIFDLYPNPISLLAYKKFKIPFAILKGFGLTPFPRPVKLMHHLSEPIYPPKYCEETFKEDVNKFHTVLVKRMKQLMQEALDYQQS